MHKSDRTSIMLKRFFIQWWRVGSLALLITITLLAAGSGAGAAAPPVVNGLIYGDGDINDYILLVEQPNSGRIYYYRDGSTLYVAVEVLRDINDNVFAETGGGATPDALYLQDADWNGVGAQHTFKSLLLSEHLSFRLACNGGAIDETWIHGYIYDGNLNEDPSEADWLSGPGDNSTGGPPPTNITLINTASSLMWNLNNFASGGSQRWDITLGGVRTTIDDYKSPGDGELDEDVKDEIGYPPSGDITYDTANGWEWPLVYEFSADISNCGDTPLILQAISAHSSPSKTDVVDQPISTTDYADLPVSYGTSDTDPLTQQDGAHHVILLNAVNPILGSLIDFEADGQPTPLADGDDNATSNDEDGVQFIGNWTGGSGEVRVTVNGLDTATGSLADVDACLNIWVDFADDTGAVVVDGDGDFEDSAQGISEHVVANDPVSSTDPQPISIVFNLPTGISPSSKVPVRARITPLDVQGGCSGEAYLGGSAISTNVATGGEIEDYLLENVPTSISLIGLDVVERPNLMTPALFGFGILGLFVLFFMQRRRRSLP